MANPNNKRVLFLCTANSCRSQMAEGLCNARWPGTIVARSAGTRPGILNPRAAAVMKEIGIDIFSNTCKRADNFNAEKFDAVITVCDNARQSCPILPGAHRVIHAPFDDPPQLTANLSNDEAALPEYRRVRDQIHAFVETLPSLLHST